MLFSLNIHMLVYLNCKSPFPLLPSLNLSEGPFSQCGGLIQAFAKDYLYEHHVLSGQSDQSNRALACVFMGEGGVSSTVRQDMTKCLLPIRTDADFSATCSGVRGLEHCPISGPF